MRPRAALALALAFATPLVIGASSGGPALGPVTAPATPPQVVPPVVLEADPGDDPASCSTRPLELPTGGATMVRCREARRIVAQIRAKLAAPPLSPSPEQIMVGVTEWLDPHGLWSAAPDSPVKRALRRSAARLVVELETDSRSETPCGASEEVGRVARDWVLEVRAELDRARHSAPRARGERAFLRAAESVFQDDPVTRPAKLLARDLGARIGDFEAEFGGVAGAVEAAVARLAPDQSVEAWSHAVLAAALRAYVPAVDPHGQWAPLDEEWALYATDPALDGEPRLWGKMVRTALGVRVVDDPVPPLVEGDLVLAVGGVATAGLSVEQAEQLAHLESIGGETTRSVVVLRRGDRTSRVFDVPLDQPEDEAVLDPGLGLRRAAYGASDVAIVTLPDVPDELGEDLERVVAELTASERPPVGVVLDLRGNGGGSMDGAVRAIGVFLPGAPVFPLKRRDGVIELQHAPPPAEGHVWSGPVAALVDGYTASAAEMIAGAVQAYRRGPVLGSRTFGKGCVQEYFDDPAGAGVLRLTTMLFALPDGAALQGVGLTPTLALDLPRVVERERAIAGSIGPWQGPDVRAPASIGGPSWPPHRGVVGVVDDPALRAAIVRLGATSLPRRSAATRAVRGARRSGPE